MIISLLQSKCLLHVLTEASAIKQEILPADLQWSAMVQRLEQRLPRQQAPRGNARLSVPPISVEWSQTSHDEEPALPWNAGAEDQDAPADEAAPSLAAADAGLTGDGVSASSCCCSCVMTSP